MDNFSNDDADYLLKLPKKVVHNNKLYDNWVITQSIGMKLRLMLASTEDDFKFLWQIGLSKKDSLKVSLHHQDHDTNIGLLRIDFNSGHHNPESINEFVPQKFHPYVDKYLSDQENHIHYHVQTYKTLAWAMPLSDDDFEIKELNDEQHFNIDFGKTITQFAKAINLQTKIIIQTLLL